MLTTLQIIQTLQELKPILQKDGFIILGLFGSYARDEADKNSDIDILYELQEPFFKQNSGFSGFSKLEEIKGKLKNIFNKDVDICAKSGLSKTGEKYILKEVIYV
jgi:predicted nucleotidyltransferase